MSVPELGGSVSAGVPGPMDPGATQEGVCDRTGETGESMMSGSMATGRWGEDGSANSVEMAEDWDGEGAGAWATSGAGGAVRESQSSSKACMAMNLFCMVVNSSRLAWIVSS